MEEKIKQKIVKKFGKEKTEKLLENIDDINYYLMEFTFDALQKVNLFEDKKLNKKIKKCLFISIMSGVEIGIDAFYEYISDKK